MVTVDFGARMKDAEKAGLLSSGDYLKLKEGGNRMRIVSEPLPHEGEFQGKRNFKWLVLVIDRTDQKVKPFFMSHTVYKQIVALQQSDDYAFDSVPMPYDLTVNADGAGTKEVKYTVMPARKESALTAAELEQVAAHKPIADVKKALDEKKGKPSQPHDDDYDAPPHTDDDN